MTLDEMKIEFLKTNSIKYLDYKGRVYSTPPPKRKKYPTTGFLVVKTYDRTEEVL